MTPWRQKALNSSFNWCYERDTFIMSIAGNKRDASPCRRSFQSVARDQLNTTQLFWGGRARPPQFHSVVLRRSRATTSIQLSYFEAVARDQLNTSQSFWGGRARPSQYQGAVASDEWWLMMIDDDAYDEDCWLVLAWSTLKNVPKCASEFIVRLWMKQMMNDNEWR